MRVGRWKRGRWTHTLGRLVTLGLVGRCRGALGWIGRRGGAVAAWQETRQPVQQRPNTARRAGELNIRHALREQRMQAAQVKRSELERERRQQLEQRDQRTRRLEPRADLVLVIREVVCYRTRA